jgi:hypothetical protein
MTLALNDAAGDPPSSLYSDAADRDRLPADATSGGTGRQAVLE